MVFFEGEPNGIAVRIFENHLETHYELLSPEKAFQLSRELQNALFVWNELNGGGQKIDEGNPT